MGYHQSYLLIDESDINFYEESATIEGTILRSEIEKVIPPATPIPQDIVVTSIVTRSDLVGRSDIVTRSDFYYKNIADDSSSAITDENNHFKITVSVNYEIILIVSVGNQTLGAIQFKRRNEYTSNFTLKEGDVTLNIGDIKYNGNSFQAELSIHDLAETALEPEEINILIDGVLAGKSETAFIQQLTDKDFVLSVDTDNEVTFDIINPPPFCTFKVQSNIATLECKHEEELSNTESNILFYSFIWASYVEGEKTYLATIDFRLEVLEGKYKMLALGDSHTCAILDDNSLKCWGLNNYGQLGYEDTNPRGSAQKDMDSLGIVSLGIDRYPIDIALGEAHTCAILDNHKVKCWGHNDKGQLGLGDITDRSPTDVMKDGSPLAVITGD